MRFGNLMRTIGLGAALTFSVSVLATGCDDDEETPSDGGAADGGGVKLDAAVDAPAVDAAGDARIGDATAG